MLQLLLSIAYNYYRVTQNHVIITIAVLLKTTTKYIEKNSIYQVIPITILSIYK